MDKKELKTPKFIIGENPMVEDSGEYITHTRQPIFIAEVFNHANKQEQSDFHNKIMEFHEQTKASVAVGRDKDFYQPFTLLAINAPGTTQDEVDEIAKIMRRMADWYQSLIKYEDNEKRDSE